MTRLTTSIAALASGLLLAACGTPKVCTPGATQSCIGLAGCVGGQACEPGGQSFGPCLCASPGGGSGQGGGSAGGDGGGGGTDGGTSGGNGGGGFVACSPSNCAGCCDGNGACVTSPSNGTNTTCGNAGNSCVNCTATANVCSSSFICVPGGSGGGAGGGSSGGCNPSTCVSGCCNGSVCVPQSAQTSASCGSGGSACAPCAGGTSCQSGSCGAAGAQVGDPCAADVDCSSLGGAFKCKKVTSSGNGTYKNGYCTKVCTASADCPSATSACVGLPPQYGEDDRICWKKCPGGDAECQGADGYACYTVTIGGTNTPVCWIDPIPAVDAGTPSDKIGNACTADSQCANPPDPNYAVCIPEIFTLSDGGMKPTGYPGGYCSADCSSANLCGSNGLCFKDYLGTGFNGCVAKCAVPAQGQSTCRQGYVCGAYTTALPDGGRMTATDGVCDPSCTNNSAAACAVTAYCDAGYCLPK